jgi:membrane protein YdbS with pleckstrin-like domain
MRPPPSERLDPKARTAWRLSNLLGTAAFVLFILIPVAIGLDWLDLVPRGWVIAGAAVATAGAIALAVLSADVSWRQWRYQVGDEEVDLQRGLLVRTRTLVPMARIQHVDSRRGPLERRFGLATVVLNTAAGAVEIPALAAPVAEHVRDRIAALANVRDDL